MASVDSAPWFSLRPSASRPSWPPPLTGSIIAIPMSLDPSNHAAHCSVASARPGVSREVVSPGTRVCEGRDLDGLLVETGARLPERPPVRWGDRKVIAGGLDAQEPLEHVEPAGHPPRLTEQVASGEQGLGQNGVGVAQPVLGPLPLGARPSSRCAQRVDQVGRIGKQASGHLVVRVDREDLGRPNGGEAHRSRPGRASRRADTEQSQGLVGELRRTGGGGAQPPECPTPAVGDARFVLPGQVDVETVAEPAVGALGAREEALVGRGQQGRGLVRLGFAGGDHQPARHVVDAVPVFQSSLGELGVLEEAG